MAIKDTFTLLPGGCSPAEEQVYLKHLRERFGEYPHDMAPSFPDQVIQETKVEAAMPFMTKP